jgi:hypothetical protein
MADQKHKDSPKSSKPRLDGLPVEILLRIVQHMDKRDAPSVARVCKSLVDPGESVIWRTVSLALGQSWGNNHRDIWELCGDVIGDTRMALDDSSLRRRERLEYTPIEPLGRGPLIAPRWRTAWNWSRRPSSRDPSG